MNGNLLRSRSLSSRPSQHGRNRPGTAVDDTSTSTPEIAGVPASLAYPELERSLIPKPLREDDPQAAHETDTPVKKAINRLRDGRGRFTLTKTCMVYFEDKAWNRKIKSTRNSAARNPHHHSDFPSPSRPSGCKHDVDVCKVCFGRYIVEQVSAKGWEGIICPSVGCGVMLQPNLLKGMLSKESFDECLGMKDIPVMITHIGIRSQLTKNELLMSLWLPIEK
ncbi:MAG: hypothetical protein M1836_002220 [Candelina mexicana]|nr:MAG: hypothetical protein M1836_002220 [Candelina mexicana]